MFCPKCGKELPDDAVFCDSCGNKVKADAKESFQATVENINNTNDTTGNYDAADIEKNKVISLFAYLGILFLIPLLATNNSKFARFHANQGLVLFITEAAWGILSGILTAISGVYAIISSLGSIALLALAIIGIVNACNGRAKELPVIGSIKLL